LVARARGLDDDVVRDVWETRIANERKQKRLDLHVAVRVRQRDDVVPAERVDNDRDGIHWCRGVRLCILCRSSRREHELQERESSEQALAHTLHSAQAANIYHKV
jgi:hypothetical protein